MECFVLIEAHPIHLEASLLLSTQAAEEANLRFVDATELQCQDVCLTWHTEYGLPGLDHGIGHPIDLSTSKSTAAPQEKGSVVAPL
jgi:hypothetical protein